MKKELLKENLEDAFANFQNALQKHTDLNKPRADGGWSVGEIANHIIKSTQANFGSTTKTHRSFDQNAVSIRETFLNFTLKFPADPSLCPDSKYYSLAELQSTLDRNKESLFKMIDEDDLTEICVDIELPGWGNLTKYEWMILIENHVIRHTRQVKDFK